MSLRSYRRQDFRFQFVATKSWYKCERFRNAISLETFEFLRNKPRQQIHSMIDMIGEDLSNMSLVST